MFGVGKEWERERKKKVEEERKGRKEDGVETETRVKRFFFSFWEGWVLEPASGMDLFCGWGAGGKKRKERRSEEQKKKKEQKKKSTCKLEQEVRLVVWARATARVVGRSKGMKG
jgi:hypothetical protein